MGIVTTSTTFNGPRQLSDGNPEGTILGISAGDQIGFYGVTATTQALVFGNLNVTAAAVSNSASQWAFPSSQQANSIALAVLQLKNLGLIS